jgi:hypothetical protein
MSGGLAVAEVLGRFGQLGVTAGFYWTHPPENSPAFWAFRAYRNFDGKGSRFESQGLTTSAPPGAALYASRNEHGSRYTAVALNFSPNVPLNATLKLDGCTGTATRRTYVYTGGEKGFAPSTTGAVESGKMEQLLPPYSMTVFDVQVGNAPQ